MRVVLLVVSCLVFLVLASPAYGTIDYKDPVDSGCGEIDPDDPCYTDSRPTVTSCTARQSLQQRCRECYQNIQPMPGGQEAYSWVCRRVTWDSGCHCNMETGCANVGNCTYLLS